MKGGGYFSRWSMMQMRCLTIRSLAISPRSVGAVEQKAVPVAAAKDVEEVDGVAQARV